MGQLFSKKKNDGAVLIKSGILEENTNNSNAATNAVITPVDVKPQLETESDVRVDPKLDKEVDAVAALVNNLRIVEVKPVIQGPDTPSTPIDVSEKTESTSVAFLSTQTSLDYSKDSAQTADSGLTADSLQTADSSFSSKPVEVIHEDVQLPAEPLPELAPEPGIQLPEEPVPELAPESGIQSTPGPLMESTPLTEHNPILDLVPESTSEPVPDPVVESALESMVEPVVESVQEPLVETSAEPDVEEPSSLVSIPVPEMSTTQAEEAPDAIPEPSREDPPRIESNSEEPVPEVARDEEFEAEARTDEESGEAFEGTLAEEPVVETTSEEEPSREKVDDVEEPDEVKPANVSKVCSGLSEVEIAEDHPSNGFHDDTLLPNGTQVDTAA